MSDPPVGDTAERGATVLDRDSALQVLLIEDSPSDRELVRALISRELPHGSVDVAARLEEALALLDDHEYDVVLADLALPDAEGAAVVRAVRAVCPETALVVLTGRADEQLAMVALAAGAQDYLVKGEHDGHFLSEALLHGVQRKRAEREARAHLAAALQLERQAGERLRELNAAKDDFVRTASHELRTPLTSIVAYAELLQEEGGLTSTQEADVAAIARNAARLTALADDLTLLAAADVRRGSRETVAVDLREAVGAVRESVSTLGTGDHLDIRYLLPDHPVLVAGEARSLERVVLNLLSNAIKFSEREGVVTCRLASTSRMVLLEVSDTGVGIPEDELSRVFDSFFRGSQARRAATQGAGLGLHLAASIVRDHGGEITVESQPGEGSTFRVRLPAVPAGRGTLGASDQGETVEPPWRIRARSWGRGQPHVESGAGAQR